MLFEGDMSLLNLVIGDFEITKSSYLINLMYNLKNKGTLFSLTLKVEVKNVHLFS